ncbi:MAG: hypothetical protein LBB55_04525 [Zoogloeaceae bacterium]|jgi:hypothetical protein|nr:hypothetical protein [Zoogloeaceae bacterium]
MDTILAGKILIYSTLTPHPRTTTMSDASPEKPVPLDPGSLQQFVSSLPEDATRAVEAVTQQLAAILASEMEASQRLANTSLLDETIQPRVRQLLQEYLHQPRSGRAEEIRAWTPLHSFWTTLAQVYYQCLALATNKENAAKPLQARLPLIVIRFIVAIDECLKYKYFHYASIPKEYWAQVGFAYLVAEKAGFAEKSLQVYPGPGGISSPHREYLKILFFQTASLNSLQSAEIELADRLIAQMLPYCEFSPQKNEQNLYWVDIGSTAEPSRINNMPPVAPHLRYFHPGDSIRRLQLLVQEAETANAVPAKIGRGENFSLGNFLNVVRHLESQWAATPPQRQHERHNVKHRVSVLPGFVNSFVMTSPEFGGKPMGLPLENWVVENVSRGGFGAVVQRHKGEWIKVGALLALQPEGADKWVIGIIRRVQRVSDNEIKIGIETLSRRIAPLEIRSRAGNPEPTVAPGTPALWLQDDDPKEPIRFLFPARTFKQGEDLEFDYNGRRILLAPVKLLEQGSDYDLATYKATVAAG